MYKSSGGDDPFADLFLIQLYFADGKKQKAIHLLESVTEHQDGLRTPEQYGFYRYLTTFFYQENSYVDQVEEEIRGLFYRDQTNWKLQWILLYLQGVAGWRMMRPNMRRSQTSSAMAATAGLCIWRHIRFCVAIRL